MPFLGKDKKEKFVNILEKKNFDEKKINNLFVIFKNFANSCEKIKNAKNEKINLINKKYLKKIGNYFFNKKKEILKKRKIAAKIEENREISNLLNELKNV